MESSKCQHIPQERWPPSPSTYVPSVGTDLQVRLVPALGGARGGVRVPWESVVRVRMVPRSLQQSEHRRALSVHREVARALRGGDRKSLIDQPPPAQLVWGPELGAPRFLLRSGVMSAALSSAARLKARH